MNARSLRNLVIAAAVLLVGLLLVNLETGDDERLGGDLLLPELQGQANNLNTVAISASGARPAVTMRATESGWVIAERNDFPADTVALRNLVVALAEARTVEPKTKDPQRYALLGVEDGDAAGRATVTLSGDGFEFGVILGNEAQRNYSYARVVGDPQSWLINDRPDIPDEIGQWLVTDIMDVAASEIRSVTISHADGEELHIFKAAEEDTDFQVRDIPEGRELSYASVANGIGGVLAGMALDDVKSADGFAGEAVASTRFETFDGRTIVIDTFAEGEESWVSVSQQQEGEAEAARWLYLLPNYKRNLLVRRWEDILATVEEEEAG